MLSDIMHDASARLNVPHMLYGEECSTIVFYLSCLSQDSVEDKWREQKAAAEENAEQEVDEQGKPLTKKQRQQLKRAAEKERAKQRQTTQDRMEPQVLLLPQFLHPHLDPLS